MVADSFNKTMRGSRTRERGEIRGGRWWDKRFEKNREHDSKPSYSGTRTPRGASGKIFAGRFVPSARSILSELVVSETREPKTVRLHIDAE